MWIQYPKLAEWPGTIKWPPFSYSICVHFLFPFFIRQLSLILVHLASLLSHLASVTKLLFVDPADFILQSLLWGTSSWPWISLAFLLWDWDEFCPWTTGNPGEVCSRRDLEGEGVCAFWRMAFGSFFLFPILWRDDPSCLCASAQWTLG